MKILNLYAGIGGNRKLWTGVEVTAVESEQYIADAYKKLYPEDTVIVGDAHQYLIEHFAEYDFIWSSPPCPTHSRMRTMQKTKVYPDMTLYQEILFLRHFFKGLFVVENVIPYYEPLIKPNTVLDRHCFWTNFVIPKKEEKRFHDVSIAKKEILAEYHGITLPEGTKDQRKLLRNAVNPILGNHIFESAVLSRSV